MTHTPSNALPDDAAYREPQPGADPEFEGGPELEDGPGLSLRQQAFCAAYHKQGNAASAARAAGYAPGNAADTGWRVLQNAQVAARIR